jgi:hypothetical protein
MGTGIGEGTQVNERLTCFLLLAFGFAFFLLLAMMLGFRLLKQLFSQLVAADSHEADEACDCHKGRDR